MDPNIGIKTVLKAEREQNKNERLGLCCSRVPLQLTLVCRLRPFLSYLQLKRLKPQKLITRIQKEQAVEAEEKSTLINWRKNYLVVSHYFDFCES